MKKEIQEKALEIAREFNLSIKERTDALLKMDCNMYTELGTDSTSKEKKEVKATSKQIYKYIKGIDEVSGNLLLKALDN